jgi:hypothetical protein
MAQLLQALTLDLQAILLCVREAVPWAVFTDIEDDLLQSSPPSQDYQAAPDTDLLRSTFPHLLHNFSEEHAVRLMMLGLRDAHAVDCARHGLMKSSTESASRLNPVDPVFRMAAHMSRAFRNLVRPGHSKWESDESRGSCASCCKSFTKKRKRHHCRYCCGVLPPHSIFDFTCFSFCGCVMCDECTPTRECLGGHRNVRCCSACFSAESSA